MWPSLLPLPPPDPEPPAPPLEEDEDEEEEEGSDEASTPPPWLRSDAPTSTLVEGLGRTAPPANRTAMMARMVRVLPVPGGPWSRVKTDDWLIDPLLLEEEEEEEEESSQHSAFMARS